MLSFSLLFLACSGASPAKDTSAAAPDTDADADGDADTSSDDTDTSADTDTSVDTDSDPVTDADRDGFAYDDDCDDADAAINPDALEVCDGADNDCDGETDDADANLDPSSRSVWYADVDGDGFGDEADVAEACAYAGRVETSGDCDDGEDSVNPSATEVCSNGVDDNCDGAGTPCGVETASMSETDADWTLQGSGDYNWVGVNLSTIRDQDGDGDDELAGGYLDPAQSTFFVGIYGGGVTGIVPYTDVIATLSGPAGVSDYDGFAAAFEAIGDADADGFDDLAIYADDEEYWFHSGPQDTSAVFTGAGSTTDPLIAVLGGGGKVAKGQDIDGDGTDDFGIGAIDATNTSGETRAGAVCIYTEFSSASLERTVTLYGDADERMGDDVAFADFDGDGVGDLVVAGDCHGSCNAYVALGPLVSGALSTTATVLSGGSTFAYSLDAGADLTADGYDDVLLSDVSGESDYAEIYVIPGESGGVDWAARSTLRGDAAGYGEGGEVKLIGDVSGDDEADVAINAGSAYGAWIAFGPFSGDRDLADGELLTVPTGNSIGGMVGGDFDGDGIGDLAISDSTYDVGAFSEAGSIFVYFGGGI